MKKAVEYYLDVVPLTAVPLSRDPWFTYRSGVAVAVGSLVTVPLFRRILRGIVVRVSDTRPGTIPATVPIKQIQSLIRPAFLTEQQIALAIHLSSSCFTPLGQCLKHFLPTITRLGRGASPTAQQVASSAANAGCIVPKAPRWTKTVRVTNEDAIPRVSETSQSLCALTPEQRHALKTISKKPTKQDAPWLLSGPPASGKTEIALRMLRETTTETGRQGLILTPTIPSIETLRLRALEHFPAESVAVLHSRLTATAFFSAWERIRTGEAQIIIGTRQALFAPFASLQSIVLDDEHDDSYKQWDMAPRYDARVLVQELARIHTARLVLISSTPRLSDWYHAREGLLGNIRLNPLPSITLSAVIVADLKRERWAKNFSPLSQPLIDEVGWALDRGEQSLLFINHQGMSHFSICLGCRNVLSCPDCGHALVSSRTKGYVCLHCRHQTDVFPRCSQCRGTEFRGIGLGTERVERELEKRFPKVPIGRLDRNTLTKASQAETIACDFREGRIRILVGTQAGVSGWNLPALSVVGIIDADSLFSLPDFHSDEKAFQLLVQAAGRTARTVDGRSSQRPRVIVQTFHPENPIIQAAVTADIDHWYDSLLADRQALRYPPFSRFALLRYRDSDPKKVDAAIETVYDALLRRGEDEGFRVSLPESIYSDKKRGLIERRILVRTAPDQAMPTGFRETIPLLKTGWSIDIDPISLH